METQCTPVEVFYSSSGSPTDAPLLEQLDSHLRVLQQEGLLTTWRGRQVVPGSDWQSELDHHLNTASLILLLVSSDFLASDYCYGIEMQRALQRHEANEARVIPLLLRPVDWQQTPFGKLKVLPSNEKPVTAWRNRDAAFTNIVQGIRMALESIQRLPSSSHASSIWNIPHRRNPHFTGRDDLLDHLVQQLAPEEQGRTTRRAALTQPRAIQGLGGIGKTQIAVEYAYRSRDLGHYVHTLWINAANEETIIASFADIAALHPSLALNGEIDQRKLIKAIKRWLEQCEQRWLLIFDNADEVSLVHDCFPQQGNGSILLTTRTHAVGSLATPLEVNTMGFIEGTQLLLRRAQRLEDASDEEINQAGNIAVALDHFPLALDQAGAYIEETQCSFVDYLNLYQTHQQVLLAKRGALSTDYPCSVATTWLLSLQKVERDNPAAVELLRLCSFLAPDLIPEELLRDGAAAWPPSLQQAVVDPFSFQQLIADLLKFSLIKRLEQNRALSIHRLVQVVQRDQMEFETQRLWVEKVIHALCDVLPSDLENPATWSQCLRYLDHVQTCQTWIDRYELANVEASGLFNGAGFLLEAHGLYSIAEPLYQRALSIREQQLGASHLHTATSLSNLASLYQHQGKYREAEPLYQRALSIREQQLGASHADTAGSLNNLAMLYERQGKYREAEPLLQRALSICEQQLGATHPHTLRNQNNLALVYYGQEKYKQAEQLLKHTLAAQEQALGATHPDTATSLNNLAMFYERQEKGKKVEQLLTRALTIYERQWESAHPDTARSLDNLAGVYQEKKRYSEAELFYHRALSMREQMLGATHPDVADNLNNLALLYKQQGKYEQAEPLYQRALSIYEQSSGTVHPHMPTVLGNLADLYRTQGKYEQAEPLYQRALSIYEQSSGATHSKTALSLNNLALFYYVQGKYAEARLLYQRALTILEQQLGATHPTTYKVRKNYYTLLITLVFEKMQRGWKRVLRRFLRRMTI